MSIPGVGGAASAVAVTTEVAAATENMHVAMTVGMVAGQGAGTKDEVEAGPGTVDEAEAGTGRRPILAEATASGTGEAGAGTGMTTVTTMVAAP